jgi:taurine dioxygenase
VFSHVGYHIIKVPENGGGTYFSHLGAAFDSLPNDKQQYWERLVSVNSDGGVIHPVVHTHPISGRKGVYLHLGMTGAIIEFTLNPNPSASPNLRLLEDDEMRTFFNEYNSLLNGNLSGVSEATGAGASTTSTAKPEMKTDTAAGDFSVGYEYEEGDFVVIDNLAVAHKAMPTAHNSAKEQGLRILHRTTVKGMKDLDPQAPLNGLPSHLNVNGPNPFGRGVWIGDGIGYRWNDDIHMQN